MDKRRKRYLAVAMGEEVYNDGWWVAKDRNNREVSLRDDGHDKRFENESLKLGTVLKMEGITTHSTHGDNLSLNPFEMQTYL